jgi:hypothetical protein
MRRLLMVVALLMGVTGPGVIAADVPAASAATPCVADTNTNQSYTTLQAAVNAAAAGDTLFVKRTCTGTTTISKNLTISGQSASGTKTATLNAGNPSSDRVLTVQGGASVTLNTLIITGGNTGAGGGIANISSGTVTLNQSTVTGNAALFEGGGIFNEGTVTLNDSTVTDNFAAGFFFSVGGGIANISTGTVIMNGGSTVTGNSAGTEGGGICNRGTLVGATQPPTSGANVFDNLPDNIANNCG